MIVDTATLAKAVGLSARHIRRLAQAGVLRAVEIRTGTRGHPTMWFDLDNSVARLDERRAMSLTDH